MGNSKIGKGHLAPKNQNRKIEDKEGKGTNVRTGKSARISTGPFRMG